MDRITLEQAVEILLGRAVRIKETEEISLWDSVGRVLAKDAIAERNQPPFARSPLDGYAVRSRDIKGADKGTPVELTVIGEALAGHGAEAFVEEGAAVRIMTGAPIPEGADCVIRQEDTDYGERQVLIYRESGAYENYCFPGEDYKAGEKILRAGAELGPVEAGILASMGMERVSVYRRARAALFTTGDELVLPGDTLAEGKIYDANLYALGARLAALGIEVVCREWVRDEEALAAEKIYRAAEAADIIITTGGVSVGKRDIMHEVHRALGCERLFWRVAVKPGMPTLCSKYGEKLLLSLSGNPYAAVVSLELLARPVLAKMTGREGLAPQRRKLELENSYKKKSQVVRYVRGCYTDDKVRISDNFGGSGVLSSMRGCNCLVEIPAGTKELRKGERVWIILL